MPSAALCLTDYNVDTSSLIIKCIRQRVQQKAGPDRKKKEKTKVIQYSIRISEVSDQAIRPLSDDRAHLVVVRLLRSNTTPIAPLGRMSSSTTHPEFYFNVPRCTLT